VRQKQDHESKASLGKGTRHISKHNKNERDEGLVPSSSGKELTQQAQEPGFSSQNQKRNNYRSNL
jgi:hypothetical protein